MFPAVLAVELLRTRMAGPCLVHAVRATLCCVWLAWASIPAFLLVPIHFNLFLVLCAA